MISRSLTTRQALEAMRANCLGDVSEVTSDRILAQLIGEARAPTIVDNAMEVLATFGFHGTRVAEQHLMELGYESALLFDHRLGSMDDRLSLSRIRVNGTDSLNEFITKVSGIHPAIMRWRPSELVREP